MSCLFKDYSSQKTHDLNNLFPNKSELFKAETVKKEASANLKMPAYLEKEARGADYLVLWLDCDREGENICFEVINCVRHVMNRPNDDVREDRWL